MRELGHLVSKTQATIFALLIIGLLSEAFVLMTAPVKVQSVSPIPNTTMDKDGVIRLTPENGCGPLAHVENLPEYGPLCVQNEGRWESASDAPSSKKPAPCINAGEANVASKLSLLSWQG